jgi:DNA polymerase/3'-5' exonuclease PolX
MSQVLDDFDPTFDASLGFPRGSKTSRLDLVLIGRAFNPAAQQQAVSEIQHRNVGEHRRARWTLLDMDYAFRPPHPWNVWTTFIMPREKNISFAKGA